MNYWNPDIYFRTLVPSKLEYYKTHLIVIIDLHLIYIFYITQDKKKILISKLIYHENLSSIIFSQKIKISIFCWFIKF
ncbi:hypothetical protein pb186bvf_014652 [Paramecium bursaria]